MSLLASGLSSRIRGFPNRKPPALLPFYSAFVAPEWRWFWGPNLRAAYPFWEGTGTIFNHGVVPRQAATLSNSTGSWGGTIKDLAFDLPGVSNADARFDLPLLGISGNTDRTVLVYCRLDNATSIKTICSWGAVPTRQSCTLHTSAANAGDLYVAHRSRDIHTTSGSQFTAGTWHLIGLRYVGPGVITVDSVNIFLDETIFSGSGVLTRIGSEDGAPDTVDADYFIGNDVDAVDARAFDGPIAWAAFFDKALPDAEYLRIARDPFGPFRTESRPLFISGARISDFRFPQRFLG